MSPKNDETKKERKLRKKLEKKQRNLEKKLRTLEKKLRELEKRQRERAKPAAHGARKAKPEAAPETARKATKRVVAKPKRKARTAKPKTAPGMARKVAKRAPRKPLPPSPAALVSAVVAVPTQNAAASNDRGARDGDAGGVTRKSGPTATP